MTGEQRITAGTSPPAGTTADAGASGVPSCHSDAVGPAAPAGAPVVALAGSPNVGKSTLFNALTGARRDMGNWPGTTVEVGRGRWTTAAGPLAVIDLPGAYSLDPTSPDEELTRELLVEQPPAERPDVVVVVASAVELSRGLYLLSQLRELPQRAVLAITMRDVAARRGVVVDPSRMSAEVGVPVVLVDARHGVGMDVLETAVLDCLAGPVPEPRPTVAAGDDHELAAVDARFDWIASAVSVACTRTDTGRRSWSDRIDRVVTAPLLGPLVFLAVMWVVFQVTTRVAAPFQDLLDAFIGGPVADTVGAVIDAVGLGDTWVRGFVIDGLVAGVGMLLTFVPLMALMFLLLALLEDSGYLARAAVVTDRLMRSIGLPGRAFLPLVVGFGCNVPAVAGTRVLSDGRQRLLTVLLVPFTSCTARLAVYVLVAATFFGPNAGNVVFAMYVLSIVLVVVVGLLLRSTLLRSLGNEPLVIDLPPYQAPMPRILFSSMWMRLRGFLRTASGIIVAAVTVVWLLSAIPVGAPPTASFGDVPVEDSAYAAIAETVAPVFVPAGFGDWHATSALMVGFVAKEAVISSWAQTYAAEEPQDLGEPGALGDALRADFDASSGGHTIAAVLAFLVFLLAYTPCVATLAAQKREIGMRWTMFGVGMQLVLAWLLAVAVFQVGRLIS
ncbi:MAG: ferrous iron transport protein B [Candidatus Nanopelagicales bacterium]